MMRSLGDWQNYQMHRCPFPVYKLPNTLNSFNNKTFTLWKLKKKIKKDLKILVIRVKKYTKIYRLTTEKKYQHM